MLDMTLVVVAKNRLDLANFRMAHVAGECADFEPVVNMLGRSLASIANEKIAQSMARVFGLVHADMEFGPGSLQAFWDCAIQGAGAVCGACGRANRFFDSDLDLSGDSSYVWSKDWGHFTARQLAAGYPVAIAISSGTPQIQPCPVSTLDSSCIFFPTNLDLVFDSVTFDGFHCHGEDICLQAQSRGIPVLVPAANAWHACADVNGPDWGKQRDVYARRLRKKWPQLDFVTT
jgi:hypothetical protein